MKTIAAICATLMGASLLAGGAAVADDRCPAEQAAAGLCAPVHFVDDDRPRSAVEGAYRRGYEDARRGYNADKFVPRPPDAALDGKEGYSLGYEQHRRYLDRDKYARSLDRDERRRADREYRRRLDRDDYRRRVERDDYSRSRRSYDREDYYERRQDGGSIATEILRRALSY